MKDQKQKRVQLKTLLLAFQCKNIQGTGTLHKRLPEANIIKMKTYNNDIVHSFLFHYPNFPNPPNFKLSSRLVK